MRNLQTRRVSILANRRGSLKAGKHGKIKIERNSFDAWNTYITSRISRILHAQLALFHADVATGNKWRREGLSRAALVHLKHGAPRGCSAGLVYMPAAERITHS